MPHRRDGSADDVLCAGTIDHLCKLDHASVSLSPDRSLSVIVREERSSLVVDVARKISGQLPPFFDNAGGGKEDKNTTLMKMYDAKYIY